MRSMVIRFAVLMMIISLCSCQTLDKGGLAGKPLPITVKPLTAEEEELIRSNIAGWEGYMQFEVDADFSLFTLLRLTEGYLEAKGMLYKKKIEEYEMMSEQYKNGQIKTQPQMPVQDYSLLISRFKVLKERFRKDKSSDAIYYTLGIVFDEVGKFDEAVTVFEELVKEFPESEYSIEVNFRLGELYFDSNQMGEAIEAYGRVVNFTDSVFYEKALYKLGWIYYKLDNFSKTVDTFMALLDRKWGEGLAENGLTDEAIYCMVNYMSRYNNLDQAIGYFESKGIRIYTPVVLARLGDLFLEQVRYEPAVSVLKHLAEAFPDVPSRPFTCERLASVYEQMGDESKSDAIRWELVNQHNPQTRWYEKNCKVDCGKIDQLVSKTLVDISKKDNYRGKKEGNINYIMNAIKGYRLFLSSYPKLPEAKVVNLLLAEALFEAQMYAVAVSEYEKAAQMYPAGAERGEIAYTILIADEIMLLKGGEGRDVVVNSASQILDTYRGDLNECGKLNSAIFKLADMLAQTGSYDKARDILGPMLKGKDAIVAYQKTAEFFIMENNFIAAEGIFLKLLGQSDEPRFKEELARVRYKIAEEQEATGRHKDAIEMFGKAFDTYPGSKIGEASLLKQGSLYIKTRDFGQLKKAANRLAKAYPASTGGVALLIEGGKFMEKEDPSEAITMYESASFMAMDASDGKKLILAAAMLAEEIKNYKKGKELFARYLTLATPGSEEEADVRLMLAQCLIMSDETEKGLENINSVIKTAGKGNDRIVARGRLMFAKIKQSSYLSVKLVQPLEETLKKKTLLLEALILDYSQIIKYKVPELQPEIYFQMGGTLENFKDSLINAEKPGDMTAQELEEYNFLLEEKSYPYEEQAVKAYEKSLQASRKHKVWNEWASKSIKKLADLRPALYKREPGEKTMKLIPLQLEPVPFGGSQ